MNPLLYFWLFFKASLFSTGGTGNLPSLHADLLARRWAVEEHFAESLMIGQLSPGPTGLWVISLGYLTDGLRGAMLALIAILLPPLLILAIEKLYRRVQNHPVVEGFIRGLSLGVIGIFVVVMLQMLGSVRADLWGIGIALTAGVIGLQRRIPLVVILGLAACLGFLLPTR